MPDTSGVQSVSLRNVYPYYAGATLGQSSSASSPYAGAPATSAKTPGANQGLDEHTERAMKIAPLGKPLPFWLLLIALTVGLGYAAKKLPGANVENFKNLKVSFFNILIVSFMSMIGIVFWKVIFTRWPVPGVTTLVNAV